MTGACASGFAVLGACADLAAGDGELVLLGVLELLLVEVEEDKELLVWSFV